MNWKEENIEVYSQKRKILHVSETDFRVTKCDVMILSSRRKNEELIISAKNLKPWEGIKRRMQMWTDIQNLIDKNNS